MTGKGAQPSIQLQSFADMLDFTVKPEERPRAGEPSRTATLQLAVLEEFPGHEEHFPNYTGERLHDMVESIRRYGVQSPILVWKTADQRRVIISGHNRVNASAMAGLTEIPAVLRSDLTWESAEALFFEMNFRQRSLADMRFSQRVLCVAAHYHMIKRQGRRTDLHQPHGTSPDTQEKCRADARIAGEYQLTRDKVTKYCRYATMYRPLLLMMDAGGKLGQLAAYEISFITDRAAQEAIYQAIAAEGLTVSTAKGKLLRAAFEAGELDRAKVKAILGGSPTSGRGTPGRRVSITLPPDFEHYFPPKASVQQIEATIQKALALYFESVERAP